MPVSPESEQPEEPTFELSNGGILSTGEQVVIIRVYRDDDEISRLGITDETMARFMGSYALVEDGERLFGGLPIPLIEADIADGTIEQIWGFECDWMDMPEFNETKRMLEDAIPDFPEPQN